jgi:erythromycin esterase
VADSETASWLRAQALPLDAVEPYDGDDFSDLLPLRDLIGDARIVALGEATHGTREFFTMKHRLVQFLVEEMGFNLFAIEDNWTEAEFVNRYVLYGEGDAETAMESGINYWTWRTEEVLDMVVWMREHNQTPGDSPLVSFHGFDMNKGQTLAMDDIVRFFQDTDPTYAVEAKANFECFYDEEVNYWYADLSAAEKDACRAGLQAVMDRLVVNQEDYVAAATLDAYQVAAQSARVVLQAEDVFREQYRWPDPRDVYMAENARWLLEQSGPQAKIVLWAHNAHVTSGNPEEGEGYFGMGYYLRQAYGDDLVVIGFAFGDGQVTAVDSAGNLTAQYVPPPPPETLEGYARQTGLPALVLNLRGLDLSQPGAAWLTEPVLLRSIGSMYDPTVPDQWFYEHDLPAAFDALIYIDQTWATRLLR